MSHGKKFCLTPRARSAMMSWSLLLMHFVSNPTLWRCQWQVIWTRARKDFRMKFAMVEWVTTIMVISIRYVLHMLIRFVLDGAQRFAYVDSEMGSEPQNFRDVFSFSFFCSFRLSSKRSSRKHNIVYVMFKSIFI